VLAGKKASKGRVIAYEPVPENFNLLKQNIALNKLNNVKIYQCAIAGEKVRRDFT
jgi:FkbM family methyltransferase